MKHIRIKLLSGAKSNQTSEFSLEDFNSITIGRNPDSDISFDPNIDDLVSRDHARIDQDSGNPLQFIITDLDSRNGVFVQKTKVSGWTRLNHGDVVQLGPGGPEFVFELDPPPVQESLRETRIADSPLDLKQTREAKVEPPPEIPKTNVGGNTPPPNVGRATVERLITQNKGQSRKVLINAIAIVIGIVVLVGGGLIYMNMQTESTLQETMEKLVQAEEAVTRVNTDLNKRSEIMTPKDIAATYGGATVYIKLSWKLVEKDTGRQIYHKYENKKPVYISLPNGIIEPWLISDDENGTNRAIGYESQSSGFIITENGFGLTNRHVAAPWLSIYPLDLPGVLYTFDPQKVLLKKSPELTDYRGGLDSWIPANSILYEKKTLTSKPLEGRHDSFNVTFPRNNLKIPARLVRTSNEHDVAMIKIDSPQSLPTVILKDRYDDLVPGDIITVLGYPGVSKDVLVSTESKDMFNRQSDFSIVPDLTVTPGNIGKVGHRQGQPTEGNINFYDVADTYQLTAIATGAGNSGGPVFDEYGNVIGIFSADRVVGRTRITYAIPIKFGIKLMGIAPVH